MRAALVCLLLVAGCATSPLTSTQCGQWQAGLAAAQAAIPGLESAYEATLSPTSKATAQDVAYAKAALDAAQVLVTADQAYLAGQCGPPA